MDQENQRGTTASNYVAIDTGRLETFSDGVFAIAMTLLVIEISVPHIGNESEGTTLFGALIEEWPSYVAYMISFLGIGILWANHHNRFRYIARSDHGLIFLNTLFLMYVAFFPFSTALLSEYMRSAERTTAVAVYSGTLATTLIVFTLIWLYASRNYRLIDFNLDPALLRKMTRRYMLATALHIFAFALAFVSAPLSIALLIGLTVRLALPESAAPPHAGGSQP